MKFEVTINTVNSASWMLCVGHGEFSIRTDKATFNVILPEEVSRADALSQLSKGIFDFCMFTPDLSDEGSDTTDAVCRSFEDAAKGLLKEDVAKPIDFYRSWTYDKYKTAVISIKEIV